MNAPPADAIRGAGRCPRCGCRKVIRAEFPTERCGDFYARELAVCVNCKTTWEPIDPSLIWDPDDALCSFREPCDNCAFRPGSPEQRDPERWRELMAGLKDGASFYCHKGVPLDPSSEHGFAYPHSRDDTPNRAKLRLCRGYLNTLGPRWSKEAATAGAQDAELAETRESNRDTNGLSTAA